MLPVIWAQGDREQQASQTSNAWMLLEKTLWEELCWSLNALQDREDESGGTAKKARRHKQWNIYQAGGKRGRFCVARAHCSGSHCCFWDAPHCTAESNLFPHATSTRMPPTFPREPSLHCLAFHFVFLTTFFSFHSQCFPYWQPGLINVFMAFFTSMKSLHNLLSKINKRKLKGVG